MTADEHPTHPASAAEPEVAVELAPAGPAAEAPAARGRRSGRRAAAPLIAVLLGLVGFALATQVHSTTSGSDLTTARQEDLVRILGDLDARQQRLRDEIAALQASRQQLTSGAQNREAALAAARQRADELGILAGTVPADGTGLQITFTSGSKPVSASSMLDAVEELRGAGAEALQLSGATGPPVRIVAATAFVDDNGGLRVDGRSLPAPYVLAVIGDPQTMEAALNIPGGVIDTVRQDGGTVTVRQPATVRVTAVRPASTPRYARPVS